MYFCKKKVSLQVLHVMRLLYKVHVNCNGKPSIHVLYMYVYIQLPYMYTHSTHYVQHCAWSRLNVLSLTAMSECLVWYCWFIFEFSTWQFHTFGKFRLSCLLILVLVLPMDAVCFVVSWLVMLNMIKWCLGLLDIDLMISPNVIHVSVW